MVGILASSSAGGQGGEGAMRLTPVVARALELGRGSPALMHG